MNGFKAFYGLVIIFLLTVTIQAQKDTETVKDFDGNIYKTVKIGSQIWMAENLRTTKLNDGQLIPNVKNNSEWENLKSPGYCFYNNDSSNKVIYGALYNWYAVNTGKLAPKGWHVPTDAEWKVLADYLGGENIAGGKLKETGLTHWIEINSGATNETGFSARGAGLRNDNGTFQFFGDLNKYWTASEGGWHENDAIYRTINRFGPDLGWSSQPKNTGKSIRCVKD